MRGTLTRDQREAIFRDGRMDLRWTPAQGLLTPRRKAALALADASQAMRFYWLTVGILCVWRITHLLQAEDGPWDVVVRLRQLAGAGFWGGLLDCFYCLSLWIAVPFALALGAEWSERLLLWPALSAGGILLEHITSKQAVPPPVQYFEEEKANDVLRQEESGISRDASDPTVD